MADNTWVMTDETLPAAFALISEHPSPAADAALVEVLAELEPSVQSAAFGLLLQRADPIALSQMIARRHDYDAGLQERLFQQVHELAPGLAAAIASESRQARLRAIELIVETRCSSLAHLLADAVRSTCESTCARACDGLYAMARALIERRDHAVTSGHIAGWNADADHLTDALRLALRRRDVDRQPNVLHAALWFADRLEQAILQQVRDARAKMTGALSRLVEETTDVLLADVAVRWLASPDLREIIGRAISRNRNPAFMRAVLEHGWLLTDPCIEKGCRCINSGEWIASATNALGELDDSHLAGGVRMLLAAAPTSQRKVERMGEMMESERSAMRDTVLSQLVADGSAASSNLLALAAVRWRGRAKRMALTEWRRRQARTGIVPARLQGAAKSDTSVAQAAFEVYWGSFEDPDYEESKPGVEALRVDAAELVANLRRKLASPDPVDRARALRVAMTLGVVVQVEAIVRGMIRDADPIVRSAAVGALGGLPPSSVLRELRARVDDPDARVQASAVEALDRVGGRDRVSWIAPKLRSPHGRVRANAIRSLLRAGVADASEALLDMMEDPSPVHRLGALWVVEQLGLKSARGRLQELTSSDGDARVRRRAAQTMQALS